MCALQWIVSSTRQVNPSLGISYIWPGTWRPNTRARTWSRILTRSSTNWCRWLFSRLFLLFNRSTTFWFALYLWIIYKAAYNYLQQICLLHRKQKTNTPKRVRRDKQAFSKYLNRAGRYEPTPYSTSNYMPIRTTNGDTYTTGAITWATSFSNQVWTRQA